MLQFIRSKAGSFVVKILFILLILSFGFFGIGDFIRQTGHEVWAISVGDHKIAPQTVQNELRQELEQARRSFGADLDMAAAKQLGLVDRTLDRLVARSLLDEEANRLGLRVGDAEIRAAIIGTPSFRGSNGQYDPKVLHDLLTANGLTEAGYIDSLRGDMLRTAVGSVTVEDVKAPKPLANLLYQIRNEQRVVDWVLLPISGVGDVGQPDATQIKTWYDQHPSAFTAPEYRGFTALVMLPADVDSQIKISDEQLHDAYQQRLADFAKPEKRHVLQILVPDEATAQQIGKALDGGADFTETGKTIGKNAADTIDMGALAKADLPGEFADLVFGAKLNETLKPIKNELGWHILKITGIDPAGTTSFAEAKPQLDADARKEAQSDALYRLSNKVADAVAAGADLSAIATQFGLKPVTVKAVDQAGKDPTGKPVTGLPLATDTLVKAAFDTAQGAISSVQESQDPAAFYVVKTDSIIAHTLKPLAAVTSEVTAAWQANQRTRKLEADATALVAAVKPDQTLAKLAEARKLTLNTTKPFARTNLHGDAPVPAQLVGQIFSLPIGGVTKSSAPDGVYIAQLKEIRAADPAKDSAGVEQISGPLNQALGLELLEEFNNGLKQRFPVVMNHSTLDPLTGGTP